MRADRAPRLATADDLPAIQAIVEAAYSPWVDVIGQKPGPMLDDYPGAVARGQIHILGDAIVVLIDQDDHLLLDNVAVHPKAQGQGLGSTLIRFAEAQAKERGHDLIRLYSHARMTSNLDLYSRCGYRQFDRRSERGLDRIYMEKRL